MAVRNRLLPYIESAGIIKTLTELLSETVLVVLNKIVAGPTWAHSPTYYTHYLYKCSQHISY